MHACGHACARARVRSREHNVCVKHVASILVYVHAQVYARGRHTETCAAAFNFAQDQVTWSHACLQTGELLSSLLVVTIIIIVVVVVGVAVAVVVVVVVVVVRRERRLAGGSWGRATSTKLATRKPRQTRRGLWGHPVYVLCVCVFTMISYLPSTVYNKTFASTQNNKAFCKPRRRGEAESQGAHAARPASLGAEYDY